MFAEDGAQKPEIITEREPAAPLSVESCFVMRNSISVTFSREINTDTLELSLKDSDETETEFTAKFPEGDNSRLNISLNEPLVLDRTYILSAPFIQDAEGESIVTDFNVSISGEELFGDDFEGYDDTEALYAAYAYKTNNGASYPLNNKPGLAELENAGGNRRLKINTNMDNVYIVPRVQSEQAFNNYILEYTLANVMNATFGMMAYQGTTAYDGFKLVVAKKYTPDTQNNNVYLNGNSRTFTQIATDNDVKMGFVMHGGSAGGTLSVYKDGICVLDNHSESYTANYGIFGFRKESRNNVPLYIDDITAYKINCETSGTSALLKPLSPALSAESFENGKIVLCSVGDDAHADGIDIVYDWYTSKNENQYPQNEGEWEKVVEGANSNEFVIENNNKYLKCVVRQTVGGITLRQYAAPVMFKPVPPMVSVREGKPNASISVNDDNMLSVSYEYMDANSDREKGTTLEWYTSKDLPEDKKWKLEKTSVISDENMENDYDFDVGGLTDTFVKCVITVRAEHEEAEMDEAAYTGTPVTLLYTLPFRPTASEVTITGGDKPGSIIKASYKYYDENGDAENKDKTRIVWYRISDNSAEKIGTGVSYAISSSDVGYSIKCEVTPVNDVNPCEGTTTASTAISVKEGRTSGTGTSASGKISGTKKRTQNSIIGNPYADNSTFVPVPEEKKLSFADIKGHWASDYIESLYQKGIVNGRDGGIFEPDAPITRAEWLSLLLRAARIDTSAVKWRDCFTDVNKSDWYAADIQAAFELGLVGGIETGVFAPNEYITREAMVKMLIDVCEYCTKSELSGETEHNFADGGEISGWAEIYVKKAAAAGFVNGDVGNRFNPKNNTTRAEASAVLTRMLELTEDEQREKNN